MSADNLGTVAERQNYLGFVQKKATEDRTRADSIFDTLGSPLATEQYEVLYEAMSLYNKAIAKLLSAGSYDIADFYRQEAVKKLTKLGIDSGVEIMGVAMDPSHDATAQRIETEGAALKAEHAENTARDTAAREAVAAEVAMQRILERKADGQLKGFAIPQVAGVKHSGEKVVDLATKELGK